MLRVFAVTQAEDIGALVDENLFERSENEKLIL